MENQSILYNTTQIGQFTEIVPTRKQTVAELLEELHLTDAYIAVLIDGEKASLNDEIDETKKIIILPKLAGG